MAEGLLFGDSVSAAGPSGVPPQPFVRLFNVKGLIGELRFFCVIFGVPISFSPREDWICSVSLFVQRNWETRK